MVCIRKQLPYSAALRANGLPSITNFRIKICFFLDLFMSISNLSNLIASKLNVDQSSITPASHSSIRYPSSIHIAVAGVKLRLTQVSLDSYASESTKGTYQQSQIRNSKETPQTIEELRRRRYDPVMNWAVSAPRKPPSIRRNAAAIRW